MSVATTPPERPPVVARQVRREKSDPWVTRDRLQPASAATPLASTDWIAELLCVAILIGCFVGIGFLSRSISQQRDDLQLVMSIEGTEGMPPHVALTTAALGTFRGLATDILWMRADELQNLGQYFEAQTLAEWITTLQPHFPNIWSFQAINMAYNITPTANDAMERWSWVSRGMELLRQRGIPLNPNAPKLYEELGWILLDKIGGDRDKEHWFLKQRLCADMQEVLGDKTSGRSTAEAIESFRTVVDAADSLEDLQAENPEVGPLLDVIDRLGGKPDEDFLRMLGLVVMVNSSGDAAITTGRGVVSGINKALVGTLQVEDQYREPCINLLIPHLQKRVLIDRYKMQPDRMLSLMEKYGPLDWRHPSAQGIYWMELGFEKSAESLNREGRDELRVIRRRLNMIAELMRTGRINYDAVSDRIDLLPDPRFIPVYEEALDAAIALIESETGVSTVHWGKAETSDLLAGYERFLNEATVLSYVYGDEQQARQCFRRLVELAKRNGFADQPIYRESLQMFVTLRLGDVMKMDVNNTRQFIDGMLNRALVDGLARGRIDVFNRFLRMAYNVYDKRYKVSDPSKAMRIQKFVDIGSFPDLVDQSFQGLLKTGEGPLLLRSRIWQWAPEELKVRAWPNLKEAFTKQAIEAGLEPGRAFPKPAGYVEEKRDVLETAPKEEKSLTLEAA